MWEHEKIEIKNVEKTFFARDGIFPDFYSIKYNIKKLNGICDVIGHDSYLGQLLSKIILDDNMIELGLDIRDLFELISSDNIELFKKIFKVIKIREINCDLNYDKNDLKCRNSFLKFPLKSQIDLVMRGKFNSLIEKGKSK